MRIRFALLMLIMSLVAPLWAAEQTYTCAYFGASYDMTQQPVPMRSQPVGYYLPMFLMPAGVGVRNYAIPGATTEQLWAQYEDYRGFVEQNQRLASCIIIGLTGHALLDFQGVLHWARTVAKNEARRSIIIALSYPRTTMFPATTLARLPLPAHWNQLAQYYDANMLLLGTRLVRPFQQGRVMAKRFRNDQDPDWVYDEFHLSNYTAQAVAALLAAEIILALDATENEP